MAASAGEAVLIMLIVSALLSQAVTANLFSSRQNSSKSAYPFLSFRDGTSLLVDRQRCGALSHL